MQRGGVNVAYLAIVWGLQLLCLRAEALGNEPGTANIGLDHVIVAVNDLEKAARRYQDLGFAVKPGRLHDNGIRNRHVKFPDGIELELITAFEAHDALTAAYRRHLADGDGPAYFGFYAADRDAVARRLSSAGLPYVWNGGLITFPETDPLHSLFFGGRNRAATDKAEHFAHSNTAEKVIALWLAGDLAGEASVLRLFGGVPKAKTVRIPLPAEAKVVKIQDAEVYLLPSSYAVQQGRKIVGVTVSVKSLDSARAALKDQLREIAIEVERSLFLPPSVTHGIWIELRERDRIH